MDILVIVDVQDEFKQFIQFDLVKELTEYSKEFDKVYQVWDSHEADKPTHYFPNQVRTVEKLFGKKHFSEEVKQFIEEAENSTEEGKLFKLSNNNGYLVRVDNNHDWFYINPDIYDMIEELKGHDITLVGGADGECLEDVKVAIETFGISYTMNDKYIYSAKTSQEDSIKEHKILRFNQFINEEYDFYDYGEIDYEICRNMDSFKKWLSQYGDYDKIDEISKEINIPVACITHVEVYEALRGKNLGKKILDDFINKCIDNDAYNVILIADLEEKQIEGFDLVKWYEKYGFTKINEIHSNPVMKMEI